jgi:hypothetical protein
MVVGAVGPVKEIFVPAADRDILDVVFRLKDKRLKLLTH